MSDLPAQPQSAPIDPKTGQWTAEWRRYLALVDKIIRELQAG